jgi:hypothetical protein
MRWRQFAMLLLFYAINLCNGHTNEYNYKAQPASSEPFFHIYRISSFIYISFSFYWIISYPQTLILTLAFLSHKIALKKHSVFVLLATFLPDSSCQLCIKVCQANDFFTAASARVGKSNKILEGRILYLSTFIVPSCFENFMHYHYRSDSYQ